MTLRLGGGVLGVLARVAQIPGGGALVGSAVKSMLGVSALRDLPDAFRGELPDEAVPRRARPPRRWDEAGLAPPTTRGLRTAADFRQAYASGRASPPELAERAIAALESLGRRSPSMNVVASFANELAVEAARRSALRFARGEARPLEGVPFVVKDQHDVAGLVTAFGGRHQPEPAGEDATLVARLAEAGAVLVAKTVMTEWGTSPIGFNRQASMPKNPHNPARGAGGSSTGSAVAVALGIGPFASGADAGGSVRIPAAFNGIFGLKPTFGRVSRAGDAFAGTLNHLGALGATSADLAAFLDAVAGRPDPRDPFTAGAPPPPPGGFGALLGDGALGLRIGIDERAFADAAPEIVGRCQEALGALEAEGARLVPIRVPLAAHAFAIGVATMGGEGTAITDRKDRARVDELSIDIRLAVEAARSISAGEFVDVQRLRVGLRRQTALALTTVDIIASPTTAVTAPLISDDELRGVFADADLVRGICKHCFAANLTGLPALSVPVGVGPFGVPVGLQLTGDAWDEAALLGVASHLERIGAAASVRPPGAFDLLG